MSNYKLILYNRQKRRHDSPTRKIEKPEAPEDQKKENFHGRRLYMFPENLTIKIS